MKLIQEVTAKANTVIREMQANLTVEEVEKLPRYHPISHFAIKNTRRKMEDRHVIIPDLNTLYGMEYQSPHAYYGVFDGHAGTDAAVYSAAHLHQYMIQNPQYETNPEAALKHAFHITDTNFIKKATKERLKGGTTAVVALVREKRLVVAWLGDSQALLVRRRNPVRMVEPHKPELPVERERVEEMGGCVINIQGTWRVLGQLAVSRAIGDVDYKPYVSSECDIKSLEIEGDEDFLILACDGLWDTLTPEAAVNVVYAYLTHNDGDTDGVGRCLVEAARNAGSEDNITAVVVFLRPVATLMEEEAQRIAQGQVPDPVPANIIYKDTTPSSINAIFSPPINQFEYSTPTTPPFNPFESDEPVGAGPYDAKVGMATEGALTPATLDFNKDGDEPMEGSEAPRNLGQDSDSDEGIAGGAEGGPEPAFNPHDAPTPTAEEGEYSLELHKSSLAKELQGR
nr:protein phosphatase 1E-like [Penaeus vannamei]